MSVLSFMTSNSTNVKMVIVKPFQRFTTETVQQTCIWFDFEFERWSDVANASFVLVHVVVVAVDHSSHGEFLCGQGPLCLYTWAHRPQIPEKCRTEKDMDR